MPSRFFVDPGAGAVAGLNGLAEVLAMNRMENKAEKQRQDAMAAQEQMQADAQAAYESGDPREMARVSLRYPQMGEALSQAMGFEDSMRERQDADFKGFLTQVLANPERAELIAGQRASQLEAQGRDATQTNQILQGLRDNPEDELTGLENQFAILYPDQYNEWKEGQDAARPSGANTVIGKINEDVANGWLTPEQGALLASQPDQTGRGSNNRDNMIADYQRLFGLSEGEAVKAADADIRLDEKGNLIAVDPVTQEATLLNIDRSGVQEETFAVPPRTDVEDLAYDPGQGTGLGSFFVNAWNSTFGQVPFLPIGNDTAEVTQNLRVLQTDAVRALGSSGRPPVVEQERILATIPSPNDPLENPRIAQQKLANFVDLMMMQYTDDLRFASNPNNDSSSRSDSNNRANEIRTVMRRVLKPEAVDAMMNTINQSESEMAAIRNMADEELLNVDIDSLSELELEAFLERTERR